MKTIGILTYYNNHLKTEQVALNLLNRKDVSKIILFAQEFKERKKRQTLFHHRPNQLQGIHVEELVNRSDQLELIMWDGISPPKNCDLYLITGAGILPESSIITNQIVNIHPGIIPLSRGLDAFKWAILNKYDLGITMHYIDKEVDAGKVLKIFDTPIYETDDIESLARRHYELEIYISSNFIDYLDNNELRDFPVKDANMRMPIEFEKKLVQSFNEYKENLFG